MKHFLTLVISHRKLQDSDYLKAFLCEGDTIFKSTLKNLKLLEENDKSPAVQKTKGWLSLASSSFSNMFSKSETFNIDKILPGIKNLLSKSDEEYDSGDLQVRKFAEKLEVLNQSFVDLYKLVTNYHNSRSEECKSERGVFYAIEDCADLQNKQSQERIKKDAVIAKIRGNEAFNNLSELQELLYATESHLVWIESVQDLISRKNELCDNLIKIKGDMKESPLNHHEIES